MSIPARFLRLLRAEINHRVNGRRGRSGRPEYETYGDETPGGAAWEDGGGSRTSSGKTTSGVDPTLVAHYRALELPYGAPLEDVRAAYKRLMKLYHPDRFQDAAKRETATEVVKRLNAAYGALVRHLEGQG